MVLLGFMVMSKVPTEKRQIRPAIFPLIVSYLLTNVAGKPAKSVSIVQESACYLPICLAK